MRDYTSYVAAVYIIAALVYGGGALLWRSRLKTLNGRLQMEEGADSEERENP